MADYIEAFKRKQAERIAEFAEYGVKAEKGKWLAAINLDAGNAEAVLKLLRKLKRLTKKAK
jgi:hypothetical protein